MSQTTPTSESLFDGGQSLREFIAKAVQHPELMDMPMETVSGLVDTGQNRDDGLRSDMTLTEFYDAYSLLSHQKPGKNSCPEQSVGGFFVGLGLSNVKIGVLSN